MTTRSLNVLISPLSGAAAPPPRASPAPPRRSPPLRRRLQPLQLQVRPEPPLLFGGRRGAERGAGRGADPGADPRAPPGPGPERPRRPQEQEQPRGHGGCGQGRLRPAPSGRKRSRPGRGNRAGLCGRRRAPAATGTRARTGAGQRQRPAWAAGVFRVGPSDRAPVSPQAASALRCERGARSGSRDSGAHRTCPTGDPAGGGLLKSFLSAIPACKKKSGFVHLKEALFLTIAYTVLCTSLSPHLHHQSSYSTPSVQRSWYKTPENAENVQSTPGPFYRLH